MSSGGIRRLEVAFPVRTFEQFKGSNSSFSLRAFNVKHLSGKYYVMINSKLLKLELNVCVCVEEITRKQSLVFLSAPRSTLTQDFLNTPQYFVGLTDSFHICVDLSAWILELNNFNI